MTSKILNNVISSRSEGDIAKLFWMCLFCPSIFLANLFSFAVRCSFASTESWGVFIFLFAFQFTFFFKIAELVLVLFCLHVHYKPSINKLCWAVSQMKHLGSGFLFGRGWWHMARCDKLCQSAQMILNESSWWCKSKVLGDGWISIELTWVAVSSSIKCFAAGYGGERDGLLVSVIDEYCIMKKRGSSPALECILIIKLIRNRKIKAWRLIFLCFNYTSVGQVSVQFW